MSLTILLFHPSVLYTVINIKRKQILWFNGIRNAIGVRILMTSYISLYYKVSIASTTVIFVILLF